MCVSEETILHSYRIICRHADVCIYIYIYITAFVHRTCRIIFFPRAAGIAVLDFLLDLHPLSSFRCVTLTRILSPYFSSPSMVPYWALGSNPCRAVILIRNNQPWISLVDISPSCNIFRYSYMWTPRVTKVAAHATRNISNFSFPPSNSIGFIGDISLLEYLMGNIRTAVQTRMCCKTLRNRMF